MPMFPTETYVKRRNLLKDSIDSGILLFLGNEESPINYADNPYPFRQDSSFLYFWGIDLPGLAAVIDIDENKEILYGRELTLDDKMWFGPLPALTDYAQRSGIPETTSPDQLTADVRRAVKSGRKVHFLPQYRSKNLLKINDLLNIHYASVNQDASAEFIKAIVALRSIKTPAEIEQIEKALDTTFAMQTLAMKMSRPGIKEMEVAGAMTGVASSSGSDLCYPIIFSVDGQILHNPRHANIMQDGDILINDSGAESNLHYASDITRTFPVSGKFTQKQKEIYAILLETQLKAIAAISPGVEYRSVHTATCKHIATGLNSLGILQGDVDAAVAEGAHALFMPHGLGHMLGLDVHDMEDLGEDYVGYNDTVQRSRQFGARQLRLGRALEPGFVLTVEPGIYFIPELIDQWKADKKFTAFINYDRLEEYRDFGGVRIEDDVLVLENGRRVLGKPIPKTIEEVENYSSQFQEKEEKG